MEPALETTGVKAASMKTPAAMKPATTAAGSSAAALSSIAQIRQQQGRGEQKGRSEVPQGPYCGAPGCIFTDLIHRSFLVNRRAPEFERRARRERMPYMCVTAGVGPVRHSRGWR